MFTLVAHIPLKSHLGVALPFLQHLTTVAAVHAIRTLPGLEVSLYDDEKSRNLYVCV